MRMRRDLALGELAHLVADRLERLVEPAVADGRAMLLAHQRRPGARGSPRCCRSRSAPRRAGDTRAPTCSSARPRSPGRTISPWLIGMPPSICARYSPSPMRTSSSSVSPKRCAARHALRIGGKLADRLHIGGEPGQPVRGALLAVEQLWRRCGRPRSPWLPTARVASASSASAAAVASRALGDQVGVSGRVAASGMRISGTRSCSMIGLCTATRSCVQRTRAPPRTLRQSLRETEQFRLRRETRPRTRVSPSERYQDANFTEILAVS